MIEHHLQKDILHRLVLHERARFGELKPKDMDGNMFTYHLQQLIAQKYVVKNDDGTYALTPEGKAAGINIKLSSKALLSQAHAILLLAVRDETGAWLLRKRLAQPNYGSIGFIHGEPVASEPIADTARAILERRTGLAADFTVAGSGYVRMFQDTELESFTAFTLLRAEIGQTEMKTADETGENFWTDRPDFSAPGMLPSMPDLARSLAAPETPFFLDATYTL
jgi:hypothetical protein